MAELRHPWLEAIPAVALGRPCIKLSTETVQQIQLDLARTFGPTLSKRQCDEATLNSRRAKVEELLVQWLQSNEDMAYMQGLHNLMAMAYREVENDDGAIQIFDYMVRQVNEDFFHKDCMKLFDACDSTSEELKSLVGEVSPEVGEKLAEAEINFFPMIIQNWMIDQFVNVLPADAAARLWDRVILANTPGTPVLTFAMQLVLSKRIEILSCPAEDLNEVISRIPNGILSPQDVDAVWEFDPNAPWASPVEEKGFCDWQLPALKLKALNARLPKRWRPWKFMALAMVVPWLLMHATAVQPRAHAARPPAFRRPCFKGHTPIGQINFEEMTLPVSLA